MPHAEAETGYNEFLSEPAALIPAHQMEAALNLPECTLPRPWE